jgi:hypothetical protein
MISAFGYLIELLGFACIVAAAWMVAEPLGLAVLGIGLVAGAQAARR